MNPQQNQQQGPPKREPRFRVNIFFKKTAGQKDIKDDFNEFEVKERVIVLNQYDRFDDKGIPHMNWKIFPIDQIDHVSVKEIDRPKIVVPSGIIHPGTPAN